MFLQILNNFKFITFQFLSCRHILSLMTVFAFIIECLLKINIPIVIMQVTSNTSLSSNNSYLEFNENQRANIVGSYFLGILISSIPSGRLSEKYGPRITIGSAMGIASIVTLLTPTIICSLGFWWIITARVLLSCSLAVLFPSFPTLSKKWIPPRDQCQFMSNMTAGNLGNFLSVTLYEYLISVCGWCSIFYFTGCITVVWTVAWFCLVYDSPKQHPRIKKKELDKIEEELKDENCFFEKKKIPWSKIIISGPVWACVIGYTSYNFKNNLILSELPNYLEQILYLNVHIIAVVSSTNYIVSYLSSCFMSYCAVTWLKTKKVSLLKIRKIFSGVSSLVPSLLITVQFFWGHNSVCSVLVYIICETLGNAAVPSYITNIMDLSSNFAGTVAGMVATGGAVASYAGMRLVTVTVVTPKWHDFEHSRFIFLVVVVTEMIAFTFYQVFASVKVQEWEELEIDYGGERS